MSLKYKLFSAGCSIIAALALGACSDWDDHFNADASILPSQNTNLWESIKNDGELTQFAALIEKTGYDKIIAGSQSFTIWAPKDNAIGFDYTSLTALSDSVLINDFVKNHISRANTLLSGQKNQERVYMLNNKLMHISGNSSSEGIGSYTIQDIGLSMPNIATANGTLHKLEGRIPFTPNIYESLDTTNHQIDSIAKYFRKYHKREIDKSKSTAGPALNGELTYIDTVYSESNSLYSLFNAYINHEDSSYTMILPTNKAWTEAKTTISEFYNYAPEFSVLQTVATATGTKDTIVNVALRDPEQLKDSMVNRMLVQNLFYNNNIYDNKKLKEMQTGDAVKCDSLLSTHRSSGEYDTKIYKEDIEALFKDAVRTDKSNGAVWLTDHLDMRTWTSWNPEIRIEAESGSSLLKADYCTVETSSITIGSQNSAVSGHVSNNSYIVAEPLYAGAHPDVYISLPGVRSTEYCVYVVFVPANITNTKADTISHKMQIEINYADASGKRKTQSFGNSNFNNPQIIDSMYVGNITFPVAYAGTGDYKPYIRIRSRVSSRENYDEHLRIDCIILRPKALDDYLKAHPDYKYDRGNN